MIRIGITIGSVFQIQSEILINQLSFFVPVFGRLHIE